MSMRTATALCAMAVDRSPATGHRPPATARGFHPAGPADPSGFAGMACDEILVHTYDAGTGLEESFSLDPRLARRLLRRLFPGSVRVLTRAPVRVLVRGPRCCGSTGGPISLAGHAR